MKNYYPKPGITLGRLVLHKIFLKYYVSILIYEDCQLNYSVNI